MEDSMYQMTGDHWDLIFINTFEAVRQKYKRDEDFPLSDDFNKKSEAILKENHPHMRNREVNTTVAILKQFRQIQNKFSRKHVDALCNRYQFYCKYFDDELANMFNFMKSYFRTDINQRVLIDISTNYDLNLISMECLQEEDSELYLSSHLLFYTMCLNSQKYDLADAWVQLRFVQNVDTEKKLNVLLNTMDILQNTSKKQEERIELNGSQEGVGSDYQLPVLRPTSVRPTSVRSSEKPWWVSRLKTSPEANEYYDQQARLENSGEPISWNSQATTQLPSESSTPASSSDELSRLLQQEASVTNRAAAKFYRESNRLSDQDMSSVPMCPVTLRLENPLQIEWKDHNGSKLGRDTNFVQGAMYHCRSFSYNAVNDEWIGKDDACHVLRPIDVTTEGVLRVPIKGDIMSYCSMESIFKVYKNGGDHKLENYLADVRAQSIAVYYADLFRERTHGKFGYPEMLSSEVVLVFDSSKRETIIEIMVRETELAFNLGTSINFIRFTNNGIYKNRQCDIEVLDAFSHFSYDESHGVLMVTDLQGTQSWSPSHNIVFVLTDPAVHCLAERPTLFGRTNFGVDGMRSFFSNVHKECNEICRYLKLKRPDWEMQETINRI